jgi:hypothetical protein
MNEREWAASTNACLMLDARGKRLSERKLRLFAVGCCRRVWEQLTVAELRTAVEMAEHYADGAAKKRDWQRTTSTLRRRTRAGYSSADHAVHWLAHADPVVGAQHCSMDVSLVVSGTTDLENQTPSEAEAERTEFQQHALLLQCVAGARYRLPRINPTWLTPDVVALARGIYAERAFDRLPILADALQDAGCDNADVLGHCRGPGPHARGCWVVDLVLGKE